MLKKLAQFITWPAITGVLAALLIIQWYAPKPESTAQSAQISFAKGVQLATPSVVNIRTTTIVTSRPHPLVDDPLFRRYLGRLRNRESIQRSLGSGVIVSSDGLVLTNHHVISGADEIEVQLQDGRTGLATVVGSDIDTDIAVMKIDMGPLQAIPLGNPDRLKVGDVVLAIGNPYGFGHSVSQGIVSALGRYGLNLNTYEEFIQTDAAVNQGNSGGALIDTEGRLVGINTAIFSRAGGALGIGLAIPSDLALRVMQDLLSFGQAIRGWMGVEVKPLYRQDNRQLLEVSAVARQGPSARAGIQVGDIITHVNTQAVLDAPSTMRQVAMLRPGDAVNVTVLRNQQELSLDVIVGQRPE